MKISIIIPYYKGDIYYERLLHSIYSAVEGCGNTNVSFELITIIDSVETNIETIFSINSRYLEGLNRLKRRIIKNESNIGVAASRNKAIRDSSGDFLHLIDQDDEITSTFYKEVVEKLEHYNFLLVNGLVNYTSKKYNHHKLYYLNPEISLRALIKDDYIRSPGQVVFSRKLIKNNLFPEPKNYKGTDDRFFWIKLFVNNTTDIKAYYIKTPNYIAYIHENNYSSDLINMKKSELENWQSIDLSIFKPKLRSLIHEDILRIKLALGHNISLKNRFIAVRSKISYFFRVNKIVRFIIKRKKW